MSGSSPSHKCSRTVTALWIKKKKKIVIQESDIGKLMKQQFCLGRWHLISALKITGADRAKQEHKRVRCVGYGYIGDHC